MLDVAFTSQFKKDMKRKRKQGAELAKIDEVITMLRSGEPLPERNRDHALSGTYHGHRECHIEPDWLLIYRIDSDLLVLTAVLRRAFRAASLRRHRRRGGHVAHAVHLHYVRARGAREALGLDAVPALQ